MTQSTPFIGELFTQPYTQPLSNDGKVLAATAAGNAYRVFYLTNSTTLTPVFQDAALTTPYAQPVFANASGQFPPIYLEPETEYRSQLFNGWGQLLEDCDTVNNNTNGAPPTMTVGGVTGFARSAFKATTTSRASNIIPTADPDLSILLANAGTYKVDADLVWTAPGAGLTPGVALIFAFSGTLAAGITDISGVVGGPYFVVLMGTVDGLGNVNITTPNTLSISTVANISANKTSLPLGTTPQSNTMRFTGTFQALSGGTFALYWCQNLTSASATSLLAGSSLSLLQVN
jgi:hypothetical protein